MFIVTDRYPFGFEMPGCSSNSEGARFGYNGKQKENELYGTANALDFGARIYDGRIAHFLSVDPLMKKFASKTPYQYAANNPISNIDVEGKSDYYYTFQFYTNSNGIPSIHLVKQSAKEDWLTNLLELGEDRYYLVKEGDYHAPALCDFEGLRFSSRSEMVAFWALLTQKKVDYDKAIDIQSAQSWQSMKEMMAVNIALSNTSFQSLESAATQPESEVPSGKSFLNYTSSGENTPVKAFNLLKLAEEGAAKTGGRVFTQTAKDGDLLFYSTKIGDDVIEFGGNFSKSKGTLTIKNFDIDGALTNKLGIRGVKDVITDFGRQQGVNQVIIQGAKRTTGANPGKIPSQLIFKID